MGVFYYFGYGSNLLRERLRLMNPSAVFKGVGKLIDYALEFDLPKGVQTTKGWHGAAATIVQKQDSYVMGCVWKIDEDQVERLDKQEKSYHPIFVSVQLESGDTLSCRTYQMDTRNGVALPSPFYMKVMIDGAKQNSMPADYVSFLEHHPTNGNTDPPKLYLDVMAKVEELQRSAGDKSSNS